MWDIILDYLPAFASCMGMAIIFGYLGIHVIKREIIFIDIAIAQIAAVGTIIAMMVFNAEENSLLAYLVSFLFVIIISVFYSQMGKRIHDIPQEAIIGVSYAIAAAGALFLLSRWAGGEHGLEHMLTGDILYADWNDIIIAGIAYLIIGLFHFIFRGKFFSATSYHSKERTGIDIAKRDLWDFIFYATIGIAIVLTVRIAGVLVIFSFLIIPATFSGFFVEKWQSRIMWAWAFGIAGSLIGMGLSLPSVLDFAPGPLVVASLGVMFILSAFVKRSLKGKIEQG
jgi:zinc/manganese transport system permease protein